MEFIRAISIVWLALGASIILVLFLIVGHKLMLKINEVFGKGKKL